MSGKEGTPNTAYDIHTCNLAGGRKVDVHDQPFRPGRTRVVESPEDIARHCQASRLCFRHHELRVRGWTANGGTGSCAAKSCWRINASEGMQPPAWSQRHRIRHGEGRRKSESRAWRWRGTSSPLMACTKTLTPFDYVRVQPGYVRHVWPSNITMTEMRVQSHTRGRIARHMMTGGVDGAVQPADHGVADVDGETGEVALDRIPGGGWGVENL